jgi:hypothetical protein
MNMMLMPDDGQLELLSGVGHLRVVRAPGVQSVAAMFNTRQLVAEDRRQLVAALRLDGVVTVYGPLCRREPTKAPPAPVPAGAPLDLLVVNTPQGLLPTAFELRRALGSRGGAVTTVTIEDAQKRLTSGTFSLLIATWMTWPPDLAASAWFTGSPRNLTGYSNPRVDEALRNSDFTRAREALADDPPAAYLCRLDRTAVVDARLVDAKLGEHDLLDSVADWRVEP